MADAPDAGEVGRIKIRGATLFSGYWPNGGGGPAADGWFVTGDAATIDAGGFHKIVGRSSIDIIKSGGFKVGAGEVESALLSHPEVVEVAVIGVPHEKWGETIMALVVLAEGEQVTEEELIRWCKDKAAGYKAPTSIEFRDQLARTATGKLQKFKLRQPYWEGQERQVN